MNHEGYRDPTADMAVSRMAREEKKQMGKMRNCRMNPEEKNVHERAVKVRKMTDLQIVKMLDDQTTLLEKAETQGYKKGIETARFKAESAIERLEHTPGIGVVTMKRVKQCCKEEGLVE